MEVRNARLAAWGWDPVTQNMGLPLPPWKQTGPLYFRVYGCLQSQLAFQWRESTYSQCFSIHCREGPFLVLSYMSLLPRHTAQWLVLSRPWAPYPSPPPIIKGAETKKKGDGKNSEKNSRLKTIQAEEPHKCEGWLSHLLAHTSFYHTILLHPGHLEPFLRVLHPQEAPDIIRHSFLKATITKYSSLPACPGLL